MTQQEAQTLGKGTADEAAIDGSLDFVPLIIICERQHNVASEIPSRLYVLRGEDKQSTNGLKGFYSNNNISYKKN